MLAGTRRPVRGHSTFRPHPSVAVLAGEAGQLLDETCLRREEDADDYYRSKIMADHAHSTFYYNGIPICTATWYYQDGWGPADLGPTSGQLARDVLLGKLPGLIRAVFQWSMPAMWRWR